MISQQKKMQGIIHIHASLNNTILTLSDKQGNTKAFASAGSAGFQGSRKSTSHAAQTAAEQLGKKSIALGFHLVDIQLKGVGFGKQPALRGLSFAGVQIQSLKDITPIPHNGCRPPKKRRL